MQELSPQKSLISRRRQELSDGYSISNTLFINFSNFVNFCKLPFVEQNWRLAESSSGAMQLAWGGFVILQQILGDKYCATLRVNL